MNTPGGVDFIRKWKSFVAKSTRLKDTAVIDAVAAPQPRVVPAPKNPSDPVIQPLPPVWDRLSCEDLTIGTDKEKREAVITYITKHWGTSLLVLLNVLPSNFESEMTVGGRIPWAAILKDNDKYIDPIRRPIIGGRPVVMSSFKTMDGKVEFPAWVAFLTDKTLPLDRRFCFLGESQRLRKMKAPATITFDRPNLAGPSNPVGGNNDGTGPPPKPPKPPKGKGKEVVPPSKKGKGKATASEEAEPDPSVWHDADTPEPEMPKLDDDSDGSELYERPLEEEKLLEVIERENAAALSAQLASSARRSGPRSATLVPSTKGTPTPSVQESNAPDKEVADEEPGWLGWDDFKARLRWVFQPYTHAEVSNQLLIL